MHRGRQGGALRDRQGLRGRRRRARHPDRRRQARQRQGGGRGRPPCPVQSQAPQRVPPARCKEPSWWRRSSPPWPHEASSIGSRLPHASGTGSRAAEQPRHPGPPRPTQGHPLPPRAPIRAPVKAAVPPRETRAPLGADSSAAAVDHTGSGPTLATSPTSACTASRPSTSSAASRAQAPSRPRTTSAPRSIRSRPSRHPNPNPDPNCNPSPNPKPNATPGPNLTLTRSRPSRRPSWAT